MDESWIDWMGWDVEGNAGREGGVWVRVGSKGQITKDEDVKW